MGSTFSSLYSRFFEKKDMRILMIGLDAAGKTTILFKLKLGKVVDTIPTNGFHVETVEYKNVNFLVRDIGRQGHYVTHYLEKCRPHLFPGTQGLIFVIDANDRERLDEATMELRDLLEEDELRDAVFLILANKQDLPNAMSTDELAEKLGELSQLRDRKWHVQSTSAITGEGLYEGLDWLANEA